MAIQQDWKIKARAHQCQLTGKPFEDTEEIYTAIFLEPSDGEDAEFSRRDFCVEAWESSHGDLQPFSYWKTSYEAPPPPEQEVMEKQSAESRLRKMIEDDAPETENSRYILALLLERKKTIKETDRQPASDGLIRIYEHVSSGEVFIVKDPQLPLSEIERLEGEVETLFGPSPASGAKADNEGEEAKIPEERCGDAPGAADGDGAEAPAEEVS